jgi:hypothetical protein
MRLWIGFALAIAAARAADVNPQIAISDIQGKSQHPFQAAPGRAALVFFITNDCPISNTYAREIHAICDGYSGKASCSLVYSDPAITPPQAARHIADYQHGNYPAIIDTKHVLVKAAGATVTPEAFVILPGGKIAYHGRIDNRYVSLGTARREATVHDVRSALDAALAGRPVETPVTTPIGCFITPLELLNGSR